LRLASNLLKEDGVMFISIDDHEVDNLRKLCSEVFGEDNFVAQIIWQKVFAPKNSCDDGSLRIMTTCLVYAKQGDAWAPRMLPQTEEMLARYKNPDQLIREARGHRATWRLAIAMTQGFTPLTCPSGRVIDGPPKGSYWRFSKESFDKLNADNRIWWGEDGNNMPRLKRFLSEVQQGRTPQTALVLQGSRPHPGCQEDAAQVREVPTHGECLSIRSSRWNCCNESFNLPASTMKTASCLISSAAVRRRPMRY
jgi:adenine-specific DNA-methyltransferase